MHDPVKNFYLGCNTIWPSHAPSYFILIITQHAQPERGKVIGVGVHIDIYVCGQNKILIVTLAIDSPFQTFAVGLLVESTID